MTRHRFRFGLMADLVTTGEQLVGTARRAEDLGFSSLLTRDHVVEEQFGNQLGPIAALATVAAVTTSLRIGSLVFCNDYRHPVMLAKEAATLDLLSAGRLELGLGAGFARDEYASAGIPFDPPGVRVSRLEESIRLLKALFADGPTTHAGTHYRVTGLDSHPKPVQQPHPPIMVAGNGRRLLSIAARHADIVSLMPVSTGTGAAVDDPHGRAPEVVEEQVGRVREVAGDRLDDLELSTFMAVRVTDDPRRAAESLTRDRGWSSIPPERVLEMPTVFLGTTERIVETLHERRERFGFSYYILPTAAMEAAARIVARAAGT